MRKLGLGMVLVMLGLATTVSADTVWNLKNDFSMNGADNAPWAYGYGTDVSNFALGNTDSNWGGWGYLFMYRGNNWPEGYPLPGVAINKDSVAHDPFSAITLQPGEVAMVPADSGGKAMIRWTCPETGLYSVNVHLQGAYSSSYSVGAEIYLNSTQIGSHFMSQSSTYDFSSGEVILTAGDQLFLVTNDGGGFSLDDWTIVDATITQVPEPMTMCLLAVGGLGVWVRRKR